MAKKSQTREKILNAATKVFFENGFEAASVKMILEEAQVVTGSFYHFFPSKEALFQCVVEEYLHNYTEKIGQLLGDDTLSVEARFQLFMREIRDASTTYYSVLQGDRLHWTIQHALHNVALEALVPPLAGLLERQMEKGTIESRMHVDTTTLAAILVKGMEAIIHGKSNIRPEDYGSEAMEKNIREFIQLLLVVHPS